MRMEIQVITASINHNRNTFMTVVILTPVLIELTQVPA